MLLSDKTAIVFGGGGSIGSAVARTFAREGARVHLVGRTLSRIQAVAEELGAAGGVARAAQLDALDEVAVEAFVAALARDAGGIDVAFNAIGMDDVQGPPLLAMPFEDFARPVRKATRAQFLTACAVGRQMVARRSGVLLTVVAPVAREATAGIGGFGVACGVTEGLWRTLAAELGPQGVRLVCLRSAGSPDTPDLEGMIEAHARAGGVTPAEMEAEFGRGALLGRLPLVAEVAEAAAMMASDRASAMTGSFLNVTCGSAVD